MAAKPAISPSVRMTPIGATRNTDYFMVSPRIVVAAPHPGTVDDGAAAKENVAFQMGYASDLGEAIGVIVLLGSLSSQDADARRVYAEHMDPALCRGTALVVNSALARAMGSFFLGLTKPRIPIGLFPTLEAAIPWVEERLALGEA